MRLTLAVLTVFLAPTAFAQSDARIDFLKKQLLAAKDPRARAQTALVLGASKSSEAVQPLCEALKDPEGVVRSAAAKALGDLKELKAVACLRPLKSDPNAQVQFAAAKAIEALESSQAQLALYVSIAPRGRQERRPGAGRCAQADRAAAAPEAHHHGRAVRSAR